MGQSKIYTFCVEPEAFNPVAKKLNELAIEKRTSRSDIIVDILFSYFGIPNCNSNRVDRRTLDFSEQIIRRSKI